MIKHFKIPFNYFVEAVDKILVFAYFNLMHTVKSRAVDRATIQLDLLLT